MPERRDFPLPDLTSETSNDVWFPTDRYYMQSPVAHNIRNTSLRVLDIAATRLYWAGPMEHISTREELDQELVSALRDLKALGVEREFTTEQHIPTPADAPEYTAKFYATHLVQLCEMDFPNIRNFVPEIVMQWGRQLDGERHMYYFRQADIPTVTRAYNKLTQGVASDQPSRELGTFISQSNSLIALCKFFDTRPILYGRPA